MSNVTAFVRWSTDGILLSLSFICDMSYFGVVPEPLVMSAATGDCYYLCDYSPRRSMKGVVL